ncbi:methylated-DNA--protein-cysteine methyltransferase isoform X1 [Echinops telfairi]|uniref:Methylated-DNA--protein-cysteine methyltransferase isoform X1 n=3 Tax=Echinops telfairi TaxID=9371 RepID=A0AC55D5V8_ECHTE|nr:methylated-DNA--protein-cysteine methyltransferase isoform X1 [Echinops telfairi]
MSLRSGMDTACELNFKVVGSPLGSIELSACRCGLHGIKLLGQNAPEDHPCVVQRPPEELPEPLACCAAWLETYFQTPAAIGTVPVPELHHPVFQTDSFARRVLWKLLQAVQVGEAVSYQQLAALVGRPKASRAVGNVMKNNPVPILIPCHRVVGSGGKLGGYSSGLAVKQWLLAHEKGAGPHQGTRTDATPTRAGHQEAPTQAEYMKSG